MTLVRPLSAVDVLFVVTVCSLVVAAVSYRWFDSAAVGRPIAAVGWVLATVFWGLTAGTYLSTGRTFLGVIGTITVLVAAYAVTLVVRNRPAGSDLTVAFAVMGLLFLPFEFVDPIHRVVLNSVAAHTTWGLSLVGFEPLVGHGPEGYTNLVLFEGRPLSHSIRIVSACSGISAMALFSGLITATRAPLRRRLLTSVAVVALIYVLNIVRAMFVAGALDGEWFGPAGHLLGVSDPAVASYYVAEYAVAQVLVVLVLLAVYVRVSSRLPELQRLVDGVLAAAATDARRLGQR